MADVRDASFAIVEALADVWIDESKRRAPVDTGQLRARTAVRSISAAGVSAEATVISDVPYAGFQEYGTRYQAPRPYFRDGRDAAGRAADKLGWAYRVGFAAGVDFGRVMEPAVRNMLVMAARRAEDDAARFGLGPFPIMGVAVVGAAQGQQKLGVVNVGA